MAEKKKDCKKIYLAHIYSLTRGGQTPGEALLENRFRNANKVSALIMEKFGHIVFSPISHSHPISKYVRAENNIHEFWLAQDKSFITDWCDEVWVVVPRFLDWKKSTGVRFEVNCAFQHKKAVRLAVYRPEENELIVSKYSTKTWPTIK